MLRLPVELFFEVVSYLPNRDIKSLRLTCTKFSQTAHLRLKRIFLSANPLNVEVFRAVADHEKFRRDVVEIIWDDVQLPDDLEGISVSDEPFLSDFEADGLHLHDDMPPAPEGVPNSFCRLCAWNIEHRGQIFQQYPDLPPDAWIDFSLFKELPFEKRDPDLPLEVSWSYYKQLIQQQKAVIRAGADAEALRYGLKRFPALRRITITPAAHGRLDMPLYETPMIRAFPPGFNYPILRTWPQPSDKDYAPHILSPWNEEKKKWRGFCVITNELAKMQDHNISEFVIDVYSLETGLSCRVFDEPCKEYNDFVTLLRKPGFSRVDLALLADGQHYDDQAWSSFRSGYLRRALAEASDLKHFSLKVRADYSPVYDEPERHCIPLRAILPTEKWKNLRHFGLSGILVEVDDLIATLATLPNTVRSIELSFLNFADCINAPGELLEKIRDTLGWRERSIAERPALIVHHTTSHFSLPMHYRCLDKSVNDFIYSDGLNPYYNIPRDVPYNHPTRWEYARLAIERYPFRPGPNGSPMETLE